MKLTLLLTLAISVAYLIYSVSIYSLKKKSKDKTKLGQFNRLNPQDKVLLMYNKNKVTGYVVEKQSYTEYVISVNGTLINMNIHSFVSKFNNL